MFEVPRSGVVDAADLLVIGYDDGVVHLSIYHFFDIGTFNIGDPLDEIKPRAIAHSSHPFSTTHLLLTSTAERLEVVPFDMKLLYDGGKHLSSLASKCTQFQHILRYLKEVEVQLYGDFIASQVLPRKFIGVVDEELREHHDLKWEQAVYHLVATGACLPELKEWLVEQVGERVSKYVFAFTVMLMDISGI